ncbi:MAG: hypothetical protein ACREF4_15675, partial [Gammaproteobacteria bacterium]
MMARADEVRERLSAELAVVELEDELVELKESGADPAALRDCKERLRAARQSWRELRAGAAVVSPATITTTASVK